MGNPELDPSRTKAETANSHEKHPPKDPNAAAEKLGKAATSQTVKK